MKETVDNAARSVSVCDMSKPLDFITIVSPSGRQSSLSTGGRQDKGNLVVVGSLEHNAEFKPATGSDRDKLVRYLESLVFEK